MVSHMFEITKFFLPDVSFSCWLLLNAAPETKMLCGDTVTLHSYQLNDRIRRTCWVWVNLFNWFFTTIFIWFFFSLFTCSFLFFCPVFFYTYWRYINGHRIFYYDPAGALLAAEHVKDNVKVSVQEGKDTRLQVSEWVTVICALFH